MRDAAKGSRVAVAVATRAARPDSIFAPSAAGCAPAPVTTRPARPTVRPSVHRSIDRLGGWRHAANALRRRRHSIRFDSDAGLRQRPQRPPSSSNVLELLAVLSCATKRFAVRVQSSTPCRPVSYLDRRFFSSRRVANHLAAPSADCAPKPAKSGISAATAAAAAATVP